MVSIVGRHLLLTRVLVFLFLAGTVAHAQSGPLTYPKILTALNATLPKGWTKERLIGKLVADVKKFKVDKPLTPDREDDLRQAGATDELIEAIRTNSPKSGGSGGANTTTSGTSKEDQDANHPLRIVSKPRASYTDEARLNNIQGTVNLNVTFESNGTIGHIEWIDGGTENDQKLMKFGLVEQAITAAREIRFEPEIADGKPVTVTLQQSYGFSIY